MDKNSGEEIKKFINDAYVGYAHSRVVIRSLPCYEAMRDNPSHVDLVVMEIMKAAIRIGGEHELQTLCKIARGHNDRDWMLRAHRVLRESEDVPLEKKIELSRQVIEDKPHITSLKWATEDLGKLGNQEDISLLQKEAIIHRLDVSVRIEAINSIREIGIRIGGETASAAKKSLEEIKNIVGNENTEYLILGYYDLVDLRNAVKEALRQF